MSTDQNYGRNTPNQTPIEPTAKNHDNRLSENDILNILQRKRDELTLAINEFSMETSAHRLVELVGDQFYDSLLLNIGTDRDRNPSAGQKYEIGESDLSSLYGTLRLMYNIVNIMEAQNDVERFEAMLKQTTGHE